MVEDAHYFVTFEMKKIYFTCIKHLSSLTRFTARKCHTKKGPIKAKTNYFYNHNHAKKSETKVYFSKG